MREHKKRFLRLIEELASGADQKIFRVVYTASDTYEEYYRRVNAISEEVYTLTNDRLQDWLTRLDFHQELPRGY